MVLPHFTALAWQEAFRATLKALEHANPLLSFSEQTARATMLWEDGLGITPSQRLLTPEKVLSLEQATQLAQWLETYHATHCPIQYLTGKAWFCGRAFHVTPEVLIPRNDTEWLVHYAQQSIDTPHAVAQEDKLTFVDMGCGSGCITLTLAHNNPTWQGVGVDISKEALTVARHNERLYPCRPPIQWQLCDALTLTPSMFVTPVGLVVSNPPYIAPWEVPQLTQEVYTHEPHTALFLPEHYTSDRWYGALAHKAWQLLAHEGWCWFEVGTHQAPSVQRIMQAQGFTHVKARPDGEGTLRFVGGCKP
ncbi:MAG: peptide chain release factor N(5)-glutamine methyltransferase [Vampirovibrionales bacterium]